MKRILAAALFLTLFAVPSFASRHPRRHHPQYNYRYKSQKNYKVHVHKQKQRHHHSA